MQEISNSEKHIRPFQKAIYLCHYPRRHETVEGERKRRGTERKVMRQDFSTTRTKTELKASPRPRSSNERSEENSTKNGRRSSELREESSSRKPEIARPRAGKLRRTTLLRMSGFGTKCRRGRRTSEDDMCGKDSRKGVRKRRNVNCYRQRHRNIRQMCIFAQIMLVKCDTLLKYITTIILHEQMEYGKKL